MSASVNDSVHLSDEVGPPKGLGITVTGVAGTADVSVTAEGTSAGIGAVTATAEVSVSGLLERKPTIAGAPVLSVFRARPAQVDLILSGLDDEMVTDVAQLIKGVAPYTEIDASPEEQWRQFMQSAMADSVRTAMAPFIEYIQSQQAEMDELFRTVFAVADSVGNVEQPPIRDASPREIKRWSAVIVFWIATAALGYWMGSSPHMDVILPSLGILASLFNDCFK